MRKSSSRAIQSANSHPDKRKKFVEEVEKFIESKLNFFIFKHFTRVGLFDQMFLDTFRQSHHILLNKVHVKVDGSLITMEFYNEALSISTECRKYQFVEKMVFTDCRILSETLGKSFEVAEIEPCDLGSHVNLLIDIIFN